MLCRLEWNSAIMMFDVTAVLLDLKNCVDVPYVTMMFASTGRLQESVFVPIPRDSNIRFSFSLAYDY